MQRKQLAATLMELLEQETGEQRQLEETTDLRQELELDSVDMVSLILRIENKFKIRIESQDFEHVVTVANLLDVLEKKLASSPQSRAA